MVGLFGMRGCRVYDRLQWSPNDTGKVALGLLHIHEQVPLKNVFAFLVLLRWFVGFIVFPPERSAALAAVDVPNGVVSGRHRTVIWLAFDDVDNAIEEVCSTMLAVERAGHHGVDGGEVGLAGRASVDAFSRKISTVAHAHAVNEDV